MSDPLNTLRGPSIDGVRARSTHSVARGKPPIRLELGRVGRLLDHARRAELAAGQQPFAIILGCSDSRVPAEIVFDQGLATCS